ncbi:unnamed protein product [Ectocarpus sp. CCAP 1310/34]|nr:unnamed protein product [Ectocarpus sp. CCAP 1310/34]
MHAAYSEAVRLLAAKSVHSDNTEAVERWLDIGTGSGLLASLVAAATASTRTEVYACEGVNEVAEVAARTFQKNGERVRLFRGRSTEMEIGRDLPSRIPRVISELLGTEVSIANKLPSSLRNRRSNKTSGLLEEGILPTLRDAKARLLSPGFVSIPSNAEVWAFCCQSSELHSMSRLLPSAGTSSGKSFRAPSSEEWKRCPGAAGPVSMHENGMVQFHPLSPSVRIFDFDFMSRDNPLPGPEGRRCEVQFPIDTISGGDGEVHAIVCWWQCFMDEDRTIVMSTSPLPPPKACSKFRAESPASTPPHRDHWRQSVYLLSRPVQVEAGDTVCAIACHDDSTVWFDIVAAATSRRSGKTVHHDRVIAGAGVPTSGPPGGKVGRDEHDWERETFSRETSIRSFPPVCVCGLHRTCSPSRIQMLNDQHRTDAFRSAIRAILLGTRKAQTQHDNRTATDAVDSDAEIVRVASGEKRRRTASACVACVSDGFLLPLLAAQEGAFEVLEIQPSTAYRAMCRDVYLANGIDIGEGDHSNDQRRVIRQFPGGILNVYELLTPSADNDEFGLAGKKLDAVVGEPFFADLSTAAWSLESLLLFWCARTALEARGCFSPRTKVMPARARLVVCPFACELLFNSRCRVGTVQGVDMSAANDGLGLEWRGVDEANHGGGGDGDERRRPGEVESLRLSEFGHQLLGPPTAVLDMDLTRPLCDLRGGRTEIRCFGHHPRPTAVAANDGGHVKCHGVVLWVDFSLDEQMSQVLSTGPEVLYWAQGVLLFEKGWLVPSSGRSFHLETALVDGALHVHVS